MYDFGSWGYFSAFMLLAWVPFGLWLFSRQRPVRAAAHTLVWAMMWLPEGAAFDPPALPPFDKTAIAAITVLIGLMWKAPSRLKAAKIGRGYDWYLWLALAALGVTVSNNKFGLHYGTYKTISIPAFEVYDALSAGIRLVLSIGIPCWIGRSILRSKQDLLDVLEILTMAGLVYTVPILYELRMSPQLHWDLYGFVSRSDFSQNMRGGGYRATVFMGHGLVVAFFMFLSFTSALILRRMGYRTFNAGIAKLPMWSVTWGLFGMLVLCKSAGALIYGVLAYTMINWTSHKAQMRVALVLSLIVMSYPVTRMFNVFPVAGVLNTTNSLLGPDRTQSMQFRFDNEDMLLSKGSERLWFGWGGFAREHVYDRDSAKDLTVQDGYWIAVFGQQGVVGFLCCFMPLLYPLWGLVKRTKGLRQKTDRIMLGGLAFMVAICAVNVLPNMSLPNLQLVLAMGLSVLAREMPRAEKRDIAEARDLQHIKAA